MWKNNLIQQIDISEQNKPSQVGTINDNSSNKYSEPKGEAISDPNPDHNENKC
jgi:hypothetical protein